MADRHGGRPSAAGPRADRGRLRPRRAARRCGAAGGGLQADRICLWWSAACRGRPVGPGREPGPRGHRCARSPWRACLRPPDWIRRTWSGISSDIFRATRPARRPDALRCCTAWIPSSWPSGFPRHCAADGRRSSRFCWKSTSPARPRNMAWPRRSAVAAGGGRGGPAGPGSAGPDGHGPLRGRRPAEARHVSLTCAGLAEAARRALAGCLCPN